MSTSTCCKNVVQAHWNWESSIQFQKLIDCRQFNCQSINRKWQSDSHRFVIEFFPIDFFHFSTSTHAIVSHRRYRENNFTINSSNKNELRIYFSISPVLAILHHRLKLFLLLDLMHSCRLLQKISLVVRKMSEKSSEIGYRIYSWSAHTTSK